MTQPGRPFTTPPTLAWLTPSLGRAYSAGAQWRRRYASRAQRQRWLRRPVISVGSITVGGAGKTPFVAALANLLLDAGERPAILSRGYGRAQEQDGVVVVRDRDAIRAPLADSGDEPLMLARQLHGCAVLVTRHRHLAGVLAESQLGCTVHVLDDGFQHFELGRNIDLVMVRPDDLIGGRTLPDGNLREPASAASQADAWIGDRADVDQLGVLAQQAGVCHVFGITRELQAPLLIAPMDGRGDIGPSGRVLLVSGVGRPDRFEQDVQAAGWKMVDHMSFPDHHQYQPKDVRAIAQRVAATNADLVLTTEKDAVRLESLLPLPFPLASAPLRLRIDRDDRFRQWIADKLEESRRAHVAR